jgi:drug/metabolite transporter (DMT)-like permease
VNEKTRGSFTADAVLAGITAFWGATFIVVKDALDDADPLSFLVLRFGLGALGLALVARKGLLDPRVWKPGGVLGLFLFVGYALQTWGLKFTTPSRSAFITSLCVVLVPFVSTAMFRRLPGWPSLLGAGLAAAGLAALTGGLSGTVSVGDALTLGCAVSYAVHITLT